MCSNQKNEQFFFNHVKIEEYWRKYWLINQTYKFDPISKKRPFYALDMFLYPSGSGLHVGHPRGYTAVDIIARMKKMQGYEVCHPIGWDSFGLPAEQYAIKNNIHPREAIEVNIRRFRSQLQSFGFSYDYTLEINTADDDILSETQKMFQYLLQNDFATKAARKSNWCQDLQTVVANEETYVSAGKLLTRIGNYPVSQRNLLQWVIKISCLADELLCGLKLLNWPKNIISQQQKWIGKQLVFTHTCRINGVCTSLNFTSGANTQKCYGVFLPCDSRIIETLFLPKQISAQINNLCQKSDLQRSKEPPVIIKLGVSIIIQNKRIFLYVWSRFSESQRSESWMITDDCPILKQVPEKFYKQSTTTVHNLNAEGFYVKKTIYSVHDWIFSRQRFWGEPFPIYYDEVGTMFYEYDLPLLLPDYIGNFSEIGKKNLPLQQISSWYKTNKGNKVVYRDPNVMPQWAGSSWYYIAYLWKAAQNQYGNNIKIRDERVIAIIDKFLPVDLYIGGKEHAVLHLIYARFWHKILKKSGLVKCDEPFQKLVTQGLILGDNMQKMSKSRGNIINPDQLILKYGADSLRCYEMFIAPLVKDIQWNDRALIGIRKWIDRFAKMYHYSMNDDAQSSLTIEKQMFFQKIIRGINNDYVRLRFNTAISKFMIFTNYCYKTKTFPSRYLKDILLMFSCICPFICEELWAKHYLEKESIFLAKWPEPEENLGLDQTLIKVVVQQNRQPGFIFECQINNKDNQEPGDLLKVILVEAKKNAKYVQNVNHYDSCIAQLSKGKSKSVYILNFHNKI